MSQTLHRRAEAELIAYGLSLPETDVAPGWAYTRYMRVKGKGFAVFGDKQDPDDELHMIVKLPISFEMIQDLWFVRESRGWYRQHQWAIIHFGPDDDPFEEMETLKGWMRQSYRAMAPKKLGLLVQG